MHLVLFAATALFASVIAAPAASCTTVATPCDTTWNSPLNQTFAYFAVGGPYVQIRAYWKSFFGCVGFDNETGALPLGVSACASDMSIFQCEDCTAPGWFRHKATGLCLTYNAPSNGTGVMSEAGTLVLRKCCNQPSGKLSECSAADIHAQTWLEPQTTKEPYNTIVSRTGGSMGTVCLTRTGPDASSC
eukprot:TRINITY_DN9465_c0_g1_i1.p1 TRINITY_DN9465_c0_g1~~TRINITY_DN9465_c0_g1_i1.p1  ORF type:complete len:189 (-),score=21.13 TRINITY_DN9465_c0_g1_i1:133-699(-)